MLELFLFAEKYQKKVDFRAKFYTELNNPMFHKSL